MEGEVAERGGSAPDAEGAFDAEVTTEALAEDVVGGGALLRDLHAAASVTNATAIRRRCIGSR
jgi:hypothetical protein